MLVSPFKKKNAGGAEDTTEKENKEEKFSQQFLSLEGRANHNCPRSKAGAGRRQGERTIFPGI